MPVLITQIHCQITTPWSGRLRIEIRFGLDETLQDQIRRWECVRVAQGSERHVFGAPCPNALHGLNSAFEVIQTLSRFKLNGPFSDTRRELANRCSFLARDLQPL